MSEIGEHRCSAVQSSYLPLHRPRLARRPGQPAGLTRGTTAADGLHSSDFVDAIHL